jgi:hypothetical protein
MTAQFESVQQEFDESERLKYAPVLVFGLAALCDIIRADEDFQDEVRVVEYECDRRNIKTLNLSAAAARAVGVPRIIPALLPSAGGPDIDKKSVLDALRAVLADNPSLENYSRFASELPSMSDDIVSVLKDSAKA